MSVCLYVSLCVCLCLCVCVYVYMYDVCKYVAQHFCGGHRTIVGTRFSPCIVGFRDPTLVIKLEEQVPLPIEPSYRSMAFYN